MSLARQRATSLASWALWSLRVGVESVGLVWLVGLAAAQARMVDATREAARALARGDTADASLGRAREVAPPGAELVVTGDDDRVVVTGSVEVDGVVITKLDGTAKGGIVVAIKRSLGVPVKLIGLGEGADDLAPFDAEAFVDALLN